MNKALEDDGINACHQQEVVGMENGNEGVYVGKGSEGRFTGVLEGRRGIRFLVLKGISILRASSG